MIMSLSGATSAFSDTNIEFLLNWKTGWRSCPYYWALKQGWCEEAGPNVRIIEGSAAKKIGMGANQMGIIDLPVALQLISWQIWLRAKGAGWITQIMKPSARADIEHTLVEPKAHAFTQASLATTLRISIKGRT